MGIGTFVNRTVQPVIAPTRHSRTSTGDLILIAAVVALGLLGLLMIYSSSTDFHSLEHKSPTMVFNKQLIWMAIGIVFAIILSSLDYHIWRKLAVPLMVLTVGLLIAVLLNNEVRNNAVRTIINGSGQPSELAKLTIIIYLSVWLFSKQDSLHNVQLGLIPLGVILGGVGGLILRQPDLSAAVTVLILGGLLFFLAGGDLRQIVLFCLITILVGWLVVTFSATGQARIGPYLDGLKDPLKSSPHVLWALEAVYKGKWFGVGIGNATTKLIGLPYASTDSVFAVIVEELGLVGAIVLIGLYGIVLWRGLAIASKAPDLLGSLMAAGLTFWIVIEAVINMAVMVGLLPFAGNALPFISAGGSNLVSIMAAIGILLGISRQSGKKVPDEVTERRLYSASVDLRRRDRRRGESRPGRAGNHPRKS
jgi:cell division protein FtsW